ncbi:MAG: hypothetical protein RLZZ458_1736, partial [Planctomycetota bacterium]
MRHLFGPASLTAGDQSWIIPAVCTAIAGLALMFWLNRGRLHTGFRGLIGPLCRGLAWLLLTACLVNPLWSSLRPRSGANVLAVAVDVSRSLDVRPGPSSDTRAEEFAAVLRTGESTEPLGWLKRLEQDFQLRRYTISDRLQQTDSLESLQFDGPASSLQSALLSIQQRYTGQPLAAILLLTDGNATDLPIDLTQFDKLPPIYPVLPSAALQLPDVSTGTFTITQSAFDDAPVAIQISPQIIGTTAGKVRMTLLAEDGTPLES